jgi:hypothetical protein
VGRVRGALVRTVVPLAMLAASAFPFAARVAGFDGFGAMTAESDYGDEIRFEVELRGDEPAHLELLLRFGDDPATFVAPVEPIGDSATFAWDADASHVVPNTTIAYSWRALEEDGEIAAVSDEASHLYDDDRPGLAWEELELGDATVHWYGDADERARRLGERAAESAREAEGLLGSPLAAPIDIFVYETRDEFFGALGPGAREWTGAAAFPNLRTVFMYLEGSGEAYLERVIVHEVTHVVFHDATDNPYHEPAHWFNEGIATWAERRGPADQTAIVEREGAEDALFAFEALTDQFPIGDRGSTLAYAQGTVMVDRIIAEHGEAAIAAAAATYREGGTDTEALEAATGIPAEQLYDDFYEAFGASQPEPVSPEPIPPSNVSVPGDPAESPGATGAPPPERPTDGDERPAEAGGGAAAGTWLAIVPVAILALAGIAAVIMIRRRATSRSRDGD